MKELIEVFKNDLWSLFLVLVNLAFVVVGAFQGYFLWTNFIVALILTLVVYYTSPVRGTNDNIFHK